MTWEHLEFEGQIPNRKFLTEGRGGLVSVEIFIEKETKELKFFTRGKLEEIGTGSMVKILNSSTPAQSGE